MPASPNPSGWRPSAPVAGEASATTVSGNRALMLEEPLLFEIGSRNQTGVDVESAKTGASRLGGLERNGLDLPGPGNNAAFGHCTLTASVSRCTFSGGTGKFTQFHATVAVSYLGGPDYGWDGTYSFSPQD